MQIPDPQKLYESLYNSNPQFKVFADSMSGKTPEQAFAENGYDFGQIQQIMSRFR